MKKKMTNREFAESNELFKEAFKIASRFTENLGIARQASKFRNGRGVAFTCRRQAMTVLHPKK